LALALVLAGCRVGSPGEFTANDAATLSWDSVTSRARGSTVVWRTWRGDPSINLYIDNWVVPRVRERFDISLRAVDGRGPEIVNQLVTEREAGARGTTDLIWINGETFHNLRAENLLFGPWAALLPSAQFTNGTSTIVTRDFEQDPAGYESPWGQVQFALIHDTVRVPAPPRSFAELAAWVRAHPGRFTHDQSFAGVTFLKSLMYALNGGAGAFSGGFDEKKYEAGSAKVFAWLEQLEPFFWRRGEVYPSGVAEMHRLFANGEIDFTMSNNHNEAVTKIRQGILPPSARPFLLHDGTIANAHFLGIPFNAPNAAAAMVVADFLLSPEAQLEKQRPDVWADGTVLDITKVPEPWRTRFLELESDARALPADSLSKYAVPEVAPEYHERLLEDWRRRIRGS
jgi:putative spermidine/putrescine transport system substrate-binding protein